MEKVTIGNHDLYHGDCREILAGMSSDTVITNPVWFNYSDDIGIGGAKDPYRLFKHAVAIIKPPKRMVIILGSDSDPCILAHVPMEFFRVQILPYKIQYQKGRKLESMEIAYCYGDALPSVPDLRLYPSYGPKAQPVLNKSIESWSNRSLKHMEWLMQWWSMPGETILDPFMVSGATLIAAELMGRKSIGIEIDRSSFDIACERLSNFVSMPKLPE